MSILNELQEEALFSSPAIVATRTIRLCQPYGHYVPPTPIQDICDKLGVVVKREDTGINFGKLVYHKSPATIYLNSRVTKQTSLDFTMAHLLGHIIFDHSKINEITESNPVQMEYQSKDPKELMCQEANKFAVNLLVPGWALHLYATQSGANVNDLIDKFKVSENVIRWQLSYIS